MVAFLRFVWFPAAIIALVLAWLRLDTYMGWRGPRVGWLGVALLLAGGALATWCTALFAIVGRGTPHPFAAKTQRLVVAGPYRWVRNPMMWGVGMLLVGLSLSLGSVGLWFGFAFFMLFVLWFVPHYEEPDMERRFGEEYREYCRQVSRWLPCRLRRS